MSTLTCPSILNRFLAALILISACLCLPAAATGPGVVAASSPTTVLLAVPAEATPPASDYDLFAADSAVIIPNHQAMAAGTFGPSFGQLSGFVAPKSGLRYTQTTASPWFSEEGAFAGRRISDVAGDLRAGTMTTADVPVTYIVRDGNLLIENTRSATALRQAGIPEAQWKLVNMTGDPVIEAKITQRLLDNELSSAGTDVLRVTGSGKGASTLIGNGTVPRKVP